MARSTIAAMGGMACQQGSVNCLQRTGRSRDSSASRMPMPARAQDGRTTQQGIVGYLQRAGAAGGLQDRLLAVRPQDLPRQLSQVTIRCSTPGAPWAACMPPATRLNA